MLNSRVVRLQPRVRPFEEAVASYRNGSPTDCLDALHGYDDVAARVLRSRAFVRLGEAKAVLAELGAVDETSLYNEGRAEILTLRAAALTIVRRTPEAREALALARVYAHGAGSAALETECRVFEAALHFACGDHAATDAAASAAVDVRPCYFDRNAYFVPREHSVARALHLRGLAAYARGARSKQTEFLRAALDALAAATTPDVWIHASLLKQLAFHVRDFDLAEDAETLRGALATAEHWPADLAPARFEIHRALGWSSALRGDHLQAFGQFRKAGHFAVGDAWRILASVDRAFLGRELGETYSAREELEHAADIAARVNWETVGEERIGLALLAAELASFDPARATALMQRYRRIATRLSPYAVNNRDERVRAHESFAEAMVHRANANPAAAEEFAVAFEIWDRLGYPWQAASAALELWPLSRSERYAEYACREAARRPHSWLARRVALLAASAAR